ncbi:hypothetical protein NUU61_004047 [Penicillium alfredii]|uniref:Uncharacterized protein n=1 Tax=Penicillium alfredii TaxID=1506179 RepID=A0A9W9FKL2_9EURO|nr:uncharacterized protein NUU61_004047 [Penicillium alfredii]KAJ5101825.1 hypothetical protein NUU61_004047 [Penicillium alfredii]
MASPSETPSNVTPPTQHQLALAMAIVKLKPPEKDIREYIQHIRHFIKHGKDSSHFLPPDKFLDSVGFWQQAYEKSEAEQSKLHDRIFELKQRNTSLLTKLRTGEMLTTKRKAMNAEKDNGRADTARKSRKLDSIHNQRGGSEIHDILDSADEQETFSVPRSLCILQQSLKRKGNSHSLATNAVILCKTAEEELLHAVQQEDISNQQQATRLKQKPEPDIMTVLNSVKLSFQATHQALHKLSATDDGRQHSGQVTYYLVCLFESTLTALTQHCTTRVNHITPIKLKVTSKRMPKFTMETRSSKTKTARKDPTAAHTEDKLGPNLSDLLCTMALSLDLARAEDQEVMEGFLFVVLNRVGKMLALVVFNNLQLPTGSCPELSFPEGLAAIKQEKFSPQNAQLEARYLVRVLHKILDAESSKEPCEVPAPRRQFVNTIKNRLQKTLLQAVFGTKEPLFKQGLMRPATPPAQALESQRSDEPGFADWFTQELWSLIGWDLLRAEFAPK